MQHKGVYWEDKTGQGHYILFRDGVTHFCIGTEESEGPDLLLHSDRYIYLYIIPGDQGCPDDYLVVEDFDGPFKPRPGGFVYDFGALRIRLL